MKKIVLFLSLMLFAGTTNHISSMLNIEEDRTDNQNPTSNQDLQQEEQNDTQGSNPQEIDEKNIFDFISSQHPELLDSSSFIKSKEKFAKLIEKFSNDKENHQKLPAIINHLLKELADSPLLTLSMPNLSQSLNDILKEIKREQKYKNIDPRGFVFDHRQFIADLCRIVEKQAYALLGATQKKDNPCIRYTLAAIGFSAGTALLCLQAYFNIK